MPMSGTVQKEKVKAKSKIPKHSGRNELWKAKSKIPKHSGRNEDRNELWPEERQALEDNNTGKTKMKKQSGKEFLKDLEKIVNG